MLFNQSIVFFLTEEGKAFGTGFFVGDDLVATVAHNLLSPSYDKKDKWLPCPKGPFKVRLRTLPNLASYSEADATLSLLPVESAWLPPARGDLALLKVVSPGWNSGQANIPHLQLVDYFDGSVRDFHSIGIRRGMGNKEGVFVRGRITSCMASGNVWELWLESSDLGSGCSGSPICLEGERKVVGIHSHHLSLRDESRFHELAGIGHGGLEIRGRESKWIAIHVRHLAEQARKAGIQLPLKPPIEPKQLFVKKDKGYGPIWAVRRMGFETTYNPLMFWGITRLPFSAALAGDVYALYKGLVETEQWLYEDDVKNGIGVRWWLNLEEGHLPPLDEAGFLYYLKDSQYEELGHYLDRTGYREGLLGICLNVAGGGFRPETIQWVKRLRERQMLPFQSVSLLLGFESLAAAKAFQETLESGDNLPVFQAVGQEEISRPEKKNVVHPFSARRRCRPDLRHLPETDSLRYSLEKALGNIIPDREFFQENFPNLLHLVEDLVQSSAAGHGNARSFEPEQVLDSFVVSLQNDDAPPEHRVAVRTLLKEEWLTFVDHFLPGELKKSMAAYLRPQAIHERPNDDPLAALLGSGSAGPGNEGQEYESGGQYGISPEELQDAVLHFIHQRPSGEGLYDWYLDVYAGRPSAAIRPGHGNAAFAYGLARALFRRYHDPVAPTDETLAQIKNLYFKPPEEGAERPEENARQCALAQDKVYLALFQLLEGYSKDSIRAFVDTWFNRSILLLQCGFPLEDVLDCIDTPHQWENTSFWQMVLAGEMTKSTLRRLLAIKSYEYRGILGLCTQNEFGRIETNSRLKQFIRRCRT